MFHRGPDRKSEQWGLLSKSEQAERWHLFDHWVDQVYDAIFFSEQDEALFLANKKEFADRISSKSYGVHQRLRNHETF